MRVGALRDNGTQLQNTDDLEDGFDIDENDAGSLTAPIADVVTVIRN